MDDEDGGSTGVCHTGMVSRGQADVVIWARKIPSEMRRSGGRGLRLSTRTRLPLIGPLLLAAPPLVICVHNLALPRPGSVDDSRGGSTGTGAPGGGSRGGRRCSLGDVNLAEGGGIACKPVEQTLYSAAVPIKKVHLLSLFLWAMPV